MIVRFSTALAIVTFLSLPARAQDIGAPPDPNLPPPVSLSYVDGEVQTLSQGAAQPADPASMLLDGDGVRTARGRAELVFGDGSLLHLDEDTAVDLVGDRRVRLLAGRAIFRASPAAADGYVLDTPAAPVRLDARGEYTLVVDPGRRDLDIAVARGAAQLDLPSGQLVIRPGEAVQLDAPDGRPLVRAFNSARADAFTDWSRTRYEGDGLSPTARELPVELRAYGRALDDNGRWDYVEPYGEVWYPAVAADWRPYYNGWWRQTRYGWTWYGNDPWAWPTHHYGRWQFSGSWFWVPARVWGPAWVSWAYAPGYVSWAPLGWDSRPALPFYLSVGIVNPNRWNAWTVLPRSYLGYRGAIRPWVVDGHRLSVATSRAFVQRPIRVAPAYAIPRGGAMRPGAPGGYNRAVPRGSYTDGRGVTRPGPASAPGARGYDGVRGYDGARRAPGAAVPRGEPSRGGAEGYRGAPHSRGTGTVQGRATEPGAVRRGAPADRPERGAAPAPAPRPRVEDRPAERRRGGAAGPARAPSYERPEASPSGSRARPGGAGPSGAGPSGAGPSRGASGAQPRGGRGGSARPAGGGGGGGTRHGSARRPPH